jgi:hypothetical protein
VAEMEEQKRQRRGWRVIATKVSRAAVPYGFAVAGLALGAAAIVQNEPIAGACGAVAGVTAGMIEQWRARFHRDHAEALRKRLRTQRLEAEQTAAQLRHTVSSLQTELWQHRMVALATPAYGVPLAVPGSSPAPSPDEPEAVGPEAESGPLARVS